MQKILTIAGRDFKTLVTSPMFLLASGFSAILLSYLYLRYLIRFGQGFMAQFGGGEGGDIFQSVIFPHIQMTNLLFIFMIPAFTMRLLAEEKKLRTYDLLLTSPITATDIALGKFLAAAGVSLCLLGISLFYPLATRILVDFSVVRLFGAYLGLFLVILTYAAVGLFSSALTESIALAVVFGWIFSLCLWFLASGAEMAQTQWMTAVLEHISIGQHFGNFVRGTLQVSSFTFLGSAIAFFVFLTQRIVESSRWR